MAILSKAFYRKVRARRDKFLGRAKGMTDEIEVLLNRIAQLGLDELGELLADTGPELLEQIEKLLLKLAALKAKLGGEQ